MDPLARFLEYAAAFEEAVRTDDWSALEPFFTENAVYEVTGSPTFEVRHEGRDAVFAGLKSSLDALDRRFESRTVEMLEGPLERGGAVWMKWRAGYSGPGVPELCIDGRKTAFFEGDRIQRLVDDIPLEMGAITEHWMSHYQSMLLPAPA